MTRARKVEHLTKGVRVGLLIAACLLSVCAYNAYIGRTNQFWKEASVSARFIMASQEAGTGMLEVSAKTGIIIFADPIAEKIFGYPHGELKGLPVSNLMTGMIAEKHQVNVESAIGKLRSDAAAPRVLVTPCTALRKNRSMTHVVIRAYLSARDETLFAAVNSLSDVVWHPVVYPAGESQAVVPPKAADKEIAN